MIRTTLALAALLALTTMASADTLTFTLDFESQPSGTMMTSATVGQGGFTFTLSRAAGFEFVDLSPFVGDGVPASWGQRSVSPFVNFADPEPFTLTLVSVPALGSPHGPWIEFEPISGEFGDFLPSDLDRGTFDGEPFLADNAGPAGSFKPGTADAVGNRIPVGGNIIFGGGSPGFEQSLFWDRLTLMAVTVDELPTSVVAPPLPDTSDPTGGAGGIPSAPTNPVPEPASLLLVALGAAAVILRRRRRG